MPQCQNFQAEVGLPSFSPSHPSLDKFPMNICEVITRGKVCAYSVYTSMRRDLHRYLKLDTAFKKSHREGLHKFWYDFLLL